MWKGYDEHSVAPSVRPQCSFASSVRAPLTPLPGPEYTSGTWTRKEWNGKVALVADQVGDSIAFAFSGNRVALFLYKQNGSKKPVGESMPGQLACWVDSDFNDGILIDLWWDRAFAMVEFDLIKEGLPDGDQ